MPTTSGPAHSVTRRTTGRGVTSLHPSARQPGPRPTAHAVRQLRLSVRQGQAVCAKRKPCNGSADRRVPAQRWVTNWSGGLPFSVSYNECGSNVNDSPNPATSGGCVPNATGHMQTGLTEYVPNWQRHRLTHVLSAQTTNVITDPGTESSPTPVLITSATQVSTPTVARLSSRPILRITKAFTIWENVVTKFRMDAFNAFNHITAGNPGGNIESTGSINGEGGGCGQGNDCGPRQLEFSLRVQF